MNTLQEEVLRRGVNFGIPPRIVEPPVLAEFELLQRQTTGFSCVSESAAERCRLELAATAREFASAKPDVRAFSLGREHRKVLKELRANSDLVITRPDKGRATVILTREAYVEKMVILDDPSKFQRVGPFGKCDQTVKVEQSLQKYVKQLFEAKEIPEYVYKTIRPVGCCCPRIYGLPKSHKPSVPLRPNLLMTGSPQYAISKWLVELLRPVLSYYSTHCVKDSFTFAVKVRTVKPSTKDYMCSFDIVSLFTNRPTGFSHRHLCKDDLS